MGEDLSQVGIANSIDRRTKLHEGTIQIGQNLLFRPYRFGSSLITGIGGRLLTQRGGSQHVVGRRQVFCLPAEGTHALELTFARRKPIFISRHGLRRR